MVITKNIGYAYATSDIAKFAGYAKTGCWFIAIYDDSKPMQTKDIVKASDSKDSMKSYAETLVAQYGRYSMHLVQG